MSLLLASGGTPASSVIDAEGVDFDGTYDYLSRSTDLTGNVDSKTFTFSCWVYCGSNTRGARIIDFRNSAGDQCSITAGDFGDVSITMRNSAGTTVLVATAPNYTIPYLTYINILISIDLTNSANRKIYISDIDKTASFTFATYTNGFIDFTKTTWRIGNDQSLTGVQIKGRLSNVFLSYDYIDLSIEANRRLFITADGKPAPTATLKALNPILYLPMKDSATAHINEGTGGNFTLNGTIATSNRGANQDNCVASYFDGSADYLSRTSLTGATANGSNFFLFNIIFKFGSGGAGIAAVEGLRVSNSLRNIEFIPMVDGFYLRLYGDGGIALSTRYDSLIIFDPNQTHTITASGDVTVPSSFKLFMDGKNVTTSLTSQTLSNFKIRFDDTSKLSIASDGGVNFRNYTLGELFYSETYIDLATSNPFWDSETNKPVPVRKAMATLGSNPLICMPLDASNAGKNYGTGGDFTANSAPYVGARGASEFWARSAKFDGSTGYLSRGALTGASDSKTFSGIFVINLVSTATNYPMLMFRNEAGSSFFHSTCSTGFNIIGYNSAGSVILNMTASTIFTAGNTYIVDFRVDLSNTSKRGVSVNGINVSTTYSTYINDTISFTSATRPSVGARWNGSSYELFFSGNQALCYFTTDYIDFSQEVNRLKFVDAFNMPLDLASQIEKGIIPNPLIYLPFDDITNLGKNLGTGGDFTVNGTVTQGSDVNG